MTGVQYSGIYFSTAVMAVTKHIWVELHFVDVDVTKRKRVEARADRWEQPNLSDTSQTA